MLARRIALIALFLAAALHARTASELQLALEKLNVVGSALYIAAHPDDENTAMLAWLSNDRLVRTGYLSITRGEGGQNLIGDEKGELLGIIRTQELLAARRIDGAEQFFTRAVDFGYSKNAEETLKIWGHDAVLADVVRVIREFQPDVIITRFPATGEGGHGHHTASAILALEAFARAEGWSPKRIFWNRFSFQRLDPNSPELANDIRVDLGTYNPLLGRAYTEMAGESRSQHKSQGFGSAERRGTIINYLKQTGGEPAKSDIFEGIDLSWNRYPGGAAVGAILRQAADTFDSEDPQKTIPLLLQASMEMDKLGTNRWIEGKRKELLEAIRLAAGISIDVSAGGSVVTPGGEIPVSVTVVNRSDYPFVLSTVASPHANPGKAPGAPLKNNQPVKTDISIKAPADLEYSRPHTFSLPITVTLQDPQMHTLIFTVPAVYRWTDPVKGEQVRSVDVVPEVTANFEAGVYLFPDRKPRPVGVRLQTFADVKTATVRVIAPGGWTAVPASHEVQFQGKGDEARVVFTITPPAGETTTPLRAEVELPGGRKLSLGFTEIDYGHIPPQRVFVEATSKAVRVDVKKTGNRIGYIMGSGDDVPNALRQMGFEVVPLTDVDLDRGDFAGYDAVVAGVRAYNTRKRLKLAHPRLMQYVANGGTYVVQYNTLDELVVPAPGPLPFKISRDRVTVEEAPINILTPAHALMTTPNRITEKDFSDWVQERGLYFTSEWDPSYGTVLSTNDPGEPAKAGGQLYLRHGKGVFVYTSYAWFRQLPAGVAGAYKLFANLVSAR